MSIAQIVRGESRFPGLYKKEGGLFRAVRNNARLCFWGNAWLCPSRPDSSDQWSGCPSGVVICKRRKCYLFWPDPSVIIFSWTDRFILFLFYPFFGDLSRAC